MNKSKTLSRKCAYCPHHSQQAKCCCHRPAKSAVNTKKSKPKPVTFINESSIHLIPEQNQNFNHINLSNLLLQNSMLKQQNSHLQNNLLSISHCINEERFSSAKNYNIPTSTTLKTESDNLADRLYLSNKNLQQAIMKVDLLGRKNKDLNDKNVQLGSEIQTLKLYNEELKQDLATAKKQLKKAHDKLTDLKTASSQCRPSTINQDYKLLRQKYQNLKFQNSNLIDEIQRLKYQISKSRAESQESMSPEWIAQTSNKLTFIEQKIDLAESKLKTSRVVPQKQPQKNFMIPEQNESSPNNAYFEIVYKLKKEVALAINTIHSKTRKFNSVFDQVGAVDNLNIKTLICTLLEGFVQNCINLNLTLERQLTRKITVLQKRMDNLMGKLQNFVLEIKNRELRKRSTSRSRILINNKSRTHSKSPSALRVLKENTIPHNNSFDKSY